jgi:hypothetical protein
MLCLFLAGCVSHRHNADLVCDKCGVEPAALPASLGNGDSNETTFRTGNEAGVAGTATSSNAELAVSTVLTLAEAVDLPSRPWTTGGNRPWLPQTGTTHDGIDAAQSGAIGHSQESWLQTTVVGPGTLTFWWRVSSEPSNDRLRFLINGTQQTQITGEVPWQLRTFQLGNGTQTLRWRYTKNSSTVRGQDRGWLDEVRFVAAGGSNAVDLIALNSVWKYLDNGSNQGAAWRTNGFDDSAWRSGPAQLSYGDGDEATVVSFGPNSNAKYLTTYFRHSFTVTNPAIYTSLLLRLQRDDGAVVYLNGAEVFRSNMPAGTIGHLTQASGGAGDENAFYSANVAASNLAAGANVLAVEIHQSSGSSSDISFNLQLIGTLAPP